MSEIKQGGETVVISVDERVSVSAEGSGTQSGLDAGVQKIVWFLLFLIPVIVIPFGGFSVDASKKFLFFGATIIALLLWALGRFTTAKLRLTADPILGALTLIPIAAALSGVVSAVPRASFIGVGLDSGTVGFLVAATIAAWLVSAYSLRASFARNYYKWLGLLALIAFVFQAVRIGLPEITSFGPFAEITMTLIGKWNDFAIFMGLTALLSLVALMDRAVRPAFARMIFLVSVVCLVVVNLYTVWVVVGICALGLLGYQLFLAGEGKRQLSFPSLILVVLSLLFIFFGAPDQFVGRQMTRLSLPSVIEVRPSWSSTMLVARDALAENAAFGVGPNRFASQWLLSKPAEVNQTIFWGVDFNTGVGYIPTFLATTGLAGALAWGIFLLVYLFSGLRTFATAEFGDDTLVPALMVWLSGLYLWLFAFIYTPDTALIILAFALTGLYASIATKLNGRRQFTASLSGSESIGIIGTVFLVALGLVLPAGGALLLGRKVYASVLVEGAARSAQVGDYAGSAERLARAVSYDASDAGYRLLTEANIALLSQVAASGSGSTEDLQRQFTALSEQAIINARRATEMDPTRYLNWVALGNVYRILSDVRVQGAYEAALDSYRKAQSLYPASPSIPLEIARLEAGRGDVKAARAQVQEALKYKSNYTDAVMLLSQIEISSGNVAAAIKSAEQAATLSPQDPGVFFQLGLLQYRRGSYSAAVTPLERAVGLQPAYSNARYFLGLSYDRLGRKTDARAQFEEILKYNSGNAEVKKIIENLKSGKAALDGVGGEAPEARETSPIDESVDE